MAILTDLFDCSFVLFPETECINLLKLKVMSLKFKKVQRKVLNGVNEDQARTYAMAKASGYCDMEKLCELISI